MTFSFRTVTALRDQVGWVGGVPQLLQIRATLADIFPVSHFAGKGAGRIQRPVDAGVQPEADIQHAAQINGRGEGADVFQFDGLTLFGEEDNRLVQFVQGAFDLAPVERGPARNVLGNLLGLHGERHFDARAIGANCLNEFCHFIFS